MYVLMSVFMCVVMYVVMYVLMHGLMSVLLSGLTKQCCDKQRYNNKKKRLWPFLSMSMPYGGCFILFML